jgi:hypothetical protein
MNQTVKNIIQEIIEEKIKGKSILEEGVAVEKSLAEKAVQVMLDSTTGFKVTSVTDKEITGTIDAKSVGPLKTLYETITFKAQIEKAPNDPDNFVVWNIKLSWEHYDGGRNGYTMRDIIVPVIKGKVGKRLQHAAAMQVMKKNGW